MGRALHSWTSLLTGELIAECRMRNLQELVGDNGLYSVPLASKLLFIFDSFREVNSILQSWIHSSNKNVLTVKMVA